MATDVQKKIIKSLPIIIKAGEKDAADILNKMELTQEEIEDTLEMVRSAVFRVRMYNTGMKPKQFQGDLNKDPIFKAAIKILQKNNPHVRPTFFNKIKAFFK